MTGAAQRHLALVVYHWGFSEQNRLLVRCLAPAVERLRSRGVRRFWFDRFDARGPHVMALYTVDATAWDLVRQELVDDVTSYLREHPSAVVLDTAELAERHRACRGKALCPLDAESGQAANNTFGFCEQPADGYPFFVGGGLDDPERLWDLVDGLTSWALGKLAQEASPAAAAADWLASLTELLPRVCERPDRYWQHHAGSLIPGLRQIGAGSEALERLERALGEPNRTTLAPVWDRAGAAAPSWPELHSLLEGVAEANPGRGRGPEALLREIVHVLLKQLGLPIKLQRPLLLFGWYRSLARESG